jgi:flagellar hook assembly protein FlgD
VPLEFRLEQNFPNPFNPETTLRYQLAKRSNVTMEVFNMLGQKVRTLVNDVQSTGVYAVTWNARSDDDRPVASGVYLCRLRADESSAVRKLVLVR